MRSRTAVLLFVLSFLSACSGPPALPPATGTTAPLVPAASPPSSPSAPVPPSPLPPTPTATPDPYAGLTLADLRDRSYPGGLLTMEGVLQDTFDFTRYLVSYESDGLRVYGFLDQPKAAGPHPVVLVLHGYIDPEIYETVTYTARYADDLARAGYVVLHPNYRDYPPSDSGPNLFRVGFAVDVLNLLATVRAQAGLPGLLEEADGGSIGLMGHSMGGGIALRVLTVDPSVRAAVLYGSMSGNERWNYEKIWEWSEGSRGAEELAVAEADVVRIQAINALDHIGASVSIHHGSGDETVPPEWSADLCARLQNLGKDAECFIYTGAPHTFYGSADALLQERVRAFFERTLMPP